MEKAADFLKSIENKDNVIIVFHNDADGCCSCALMNNFLKKSIGKPADFIISQPMPPAKNLIPKIRLSMPTKIIFLDLGVDQNPAMIKKLENDCEILIIDHHQLQNNMNSLRTIHCNPMFKSRKYQSVSYLAYKICSDLMDMKPYLWIAMVGIVGDYNTEDSLDMIDEAQKMYPELIKSKSQDALHKSVFGQIADMISAAKADKISCEEITRTLNSCESQEDFMKNEKLTESYRKVQEEIEHVIIDAKSIASSSDKVVFYEIKSRFNIHSPVSTNISKEFPKKLIIVWEEIGNKIKISARNQGKNLNVGKLLKEAVRDLRHASAGGHEAAGGVSLRTEDWKEFVDKIKLLVS